MTSKEPLFTYSFIVACVGNFLLFFGFYLLLPILPIYLMDVFSVSKTIVGVILSCYVVSAMLIRPFSAYFVDRFSRKPLYLMAYAIFALLFISYPLAGSVLAFLLLRTLHGLAFGTVSTAGNTLLIDIMPPSRRGEGLGYFGTANNIAMATGPMTGMFIYDFGYGYEPIFYTAILAGVLGFCLVTTIKVKKRPILAENGPISFDRFFLPNGFLNGFCLLLLAFPYGMNSSYVALYGMQLGITGNTGLFFSLMALGMITSRLISGKKVDRGKLTQIIALGSVLVCICFIFFSQLDMLGEWVHLGYFATALCLGISYGMMFPAYNALFVNLAPHNRRATASSTYLTSWDIGVGIGLIAGGATAEGYGFDVAYALGAVLSAISSLVFILWGSDYYHRHQVSEGI